MNSTATALLEELKTFPAGETVTVELTDVIFPRRLLSRWNNVMRCFQTIDDGEVRIEGEHVTWAQVRYDVVELTEAPDVLARVIRTLGELSRLR